MTNSLKYPHDRVNGYVQLKDGNGNLYVPDFHALGTENDAGESMKYAGAFLILANRIIDDHQDAKAGK